MTSPDGTRAFPPGQIIDPAGDVWSIGSDGRLYRRGTRTTWSATELLEYAGALHAKSPSGGFWWRWGGSVWTRLTTADPAPVPDLAAQIAALTAKVTDLQTQLAAPPVLSATPTLSGVNAVWSGIKAPAPLNWIGVYQSGMPSQSWLDWSYVSGSKVAGAFSAAGLCALVMPDLSPDRYELRLYADNTMTTELLAISPLFTYPGAVPWEIWSRCPGPAFDLLAIGTSLDLRNYVYDLNRFVLTFALNPASAPIDGIATLADGIVTRTGPGDLSGVLFDVVAA